MVSRQEAKLFIGIAASLTLFLLILSEAWIRHYTTDNQFIWILIVMISTMIGVDLFQQGGGNGGSGGTAG